MGIMDFAEEAAGAFAADKALGAVDPNAGFLTKAAAAVAGFEGVSMLKEHMGATAAQPAEGEQAADTGDDSNQDSSFAQA